MDYNNYDVEVVMFERDNQEIYIPGGGDNSLESLARTTHLAIAAHQDDIEIMAVEGILLVGGNGEVLCYHKSEKQVMEDFLFRNTRLEKGSLDKDKYGFLEKENGVYYFKLNAKIGLVKR